MHNFNYYSPTEIVFGLDTEYKVSRYIKKYGGSRVMIVYGGGSVKRSGLLDRVKQCLEESGISYVEFGGVQPNPRLQHAREGVKLAIEEKIDFMLAVGGGSVIDTAKAVSYGAAVPEIDIWDYWCGKEKPFKALPTGVILTIPAAGSESSNSAVLTNTEIKMKRGLSTDLNRPRFAIMNPELCYTLPDYQVSCGITDIMMHTMDRYFNPVDNELTDALAEALLRTVIAQGRVLVKDKTSYDAMSDIMWAGSLSHNGLTGLGGNGDWAVHQLGHGLSAIYDLAHGASLAAVWGSWAKYVYMEKPSRFARYARNVWGITEEDDVKAAEAGIAATVEYFRSINMPVSLTEAVGSRNEEQLEALAENCSYSGTRTIGSFRKLDKSDIYNIYKAAN